MARIAIIGGGPAGAAAGAGLARAGHDVTIVESRAFPRAKVCGEFVSPAATRDLESLVDRATLASLGARRIDRFVLELGDREQCVPLAEPAWALSRASLDDSLLRSAAGAGASILQPESVADVEYHDDHVALSFASGRRFEADHVVHADGHGRHDPAGPISCAGGAVGMKCHMRIPGGVSGVRIRAASGAYVGTITVEGLLSTCALVARAPLVGAWRGDLDGLLRSLWPGYDRRFRVGEWMACGVARSAYVEPGHARSWRIGNAAAAVDPIGGEGIGLALWSGGALARAASRSGFSPESRRVLRRQYRARLRYRRPACAIGAWALMRPALIRAAWPLIGADRGIGRVMMRLTGKPAPAGVDF